MDLAFLVEELKQFEELRQVPEVQLQWLVAHSELRTYPVGSHLFQRGVPIEEMAIILEGKVRIYLEQNGQSREYASVEGKQQGAITGLLPYSRMKSSTGNGQVVRKLRCLVTSKKVFPEMIREQYDLTAALVHAMLSRTRIFTSLQLQNEKLLALGKLSAGLAHELNNPASAIVRSATALKEHLGYLPESFKQAINTEITPAQVDVVNGLLFGKLEEDRPVLSLMERTDREDELTDWLETFVEVEDSDVISTLVEFGVGRGELEEIVETAGSQFITPIINWMSQVLTTEKMVREIQDASSRIKDLVSSVKGYTHMDQEPVRQAVDIHQGLRSTLIMFKHRVQLKQISVIEDFCQGLPKAMGFAGELNQVWTNLIDNAIDALPKGGTLTLRTAVEGPCLRIEVIDNGSGIPREIQDRIFEPFYTTKDVGKGTGIGLDIVQKIMLHHRASISVSSEPGHTVFSILMPIQ